MSFDRDINKLADRYKRRMRAVVQESTQRTVAMAQEVGPSVANPDANAGGRMPVDTGFLRASGGAALESPPTGPTKNQTGAKVTGQVSGQPLPVILSTWQPGQDIYWGWTASHARFMESRYGFARGAAEKWPDTVKEVTRIVSKRI